MAVKLEIEIDGELKEFSIPQDWNEVTVKQTADLASLKKDNKTEVEFMVNILSVLANIDEDIVYMMQQEDFIKIIETIKFTNQEIKGELKEFITIDGEDYYLKKDFDKMTMGEIISIETILKQSDNNYQVALPQLLCIFLRKKKDNGKLESFKNEFMARALIFQKAIITDVNDIFSFFLNGRVL